MIFAKTFFYLCMAKQNKDYNWTKDPSKIYDLLKSQQTKERFVFFRSPKCTDIIGYYGAKGVWEFRDTTGRISFYINPFLDSFERQLTELIDRFDPKFLIP